MSKYPNNESINELEPELMGIGGLIAFINHNSSSRQAMGTNMVGQSIVNTNNTTRRIFTGAEYEFSRFTFKQQMPEDGVVIAVIPKFPVNNVFMEKIPENPRTIVFFEKFTDEGTRVIDVLDLSSFHLLHEKYGFKHVFKDYADTLLTPGSFIPKDTVISDSPNVTDDGFYKSGMDINVALMSHPVGIEDGFGISESLYHKTAATAFGKRSIACGKTHYLLDLYGEGDVVKPFPGIGENIRDDRILFASREFNESMTIVDMMSARPGRPSAMRKVNNLFDKRVYVEKPGKVIDITVFKNHVRKSNLPTGVTAWLDKWHQLNLNFFSKIISQHQALNKRYPDGYEISPALEVLLTEAYSFNINGNTNHLGIDKGDNIIRTIGGQPLDEYNIQITYEYKVYPFIGAKFSGTAGDKGVNVRILPDSHMPIDKDGNRADLIADDFSAIKRMIGSRPHEHYFGACTLKIEKQLKELVDKNDYVTAWDLLSGFYQTISPKMWEEAVLFSGLNKDPESIKNHIDYILKNKLSIWAPFNQKKEVVQIIRELSEKYPPCHDVITYVDLEGNKQVTKEKILIGPLYFMLLEKTNTPFAATSSTRYQHHGALATITGNERNFLPARNNPVKVTSESEVRHHVSNVGSDALAELLEQTNSPDSHRAICEAIYNTPTPTNIDRVIDRSEVPRGTSKANQYIRSQFNSAGFNIKRHGDE